VLRIATRLQMPLPLVATLGWPVPAPLRDTLYDQVGVLAGGGGGRGRYDQVWVCGRGVGRVRYA
jgi:hypothetical protein